MFEIIVDDREVQKALDDFAKISGEELEKLFREEFVLLIKELIKLTPPKKRGDSAKKIEQDLRTLFRASQKMEFRDKFLQKLSRQGNTQKLAEVLQKIDGENRRFISETPTESRHNRNRDRRGRVVRNPRFQVVTKTADFNKFKREKLKTIGTAKGGWFPKNKDLGVKAAAWIKNNKSGKYSEKKSKDELELSITNTVEYISKLNTDFKIVDRAVRNRRTKLLSKLKRATRAIVKDINRRK